ncbi:MAG: hypothetical protein ACRENG_06265 [bacterium]
MVHQIETDAYIRHALTAKTTTFATTLPAPLGEQAEEMLKTPTCSTSLYWRRQQKLEAEWALLTIFKNGKTFPEFHHRQSAWPTPKIKNPDFILGSCFAPEVGLEPTAR